MNTIENLKNSFDLEFERTKQDMNEFSGCATASKLFKELLGDKVKILDSFGSGKLTATFKKIQLEASGVRGYRQIRISNAHQHIVGFELNRYSKFDEVVVGDIYLDIDFKCIVFKNIEVNAPMGSTHAKFFIKEIGFPDLFYQKKEKVWSQLRTSFHGTYESNYIDLNDCNRLKIPTYTDFTHKQQSRSIVLVVGVEFFQNVGDKYYLFQTGNAAKVLNVF